jgi:hypothetical protein
VAMLGSLSEERETECKEEMEDEGACVCCGYKRLSGIDMMELYAAAGHLYLFGIYQEIIYRVFGFSCPPADSGVLEIKKIELIREIQKINIITNSDSNRTK